MIETAQAKVSLSDRLKAHLAIARLDHSIKNLFVLPGDYRAAERRSVLADWHLLGRWCGRLCPITLVACSNYVINEVLDAPFDRLHPTKKNRPAAKGLVNIPLAYVQWIVMMLVGVAIGWTISKPFALTALVLWLMGCAYNIKPLRTKDVPYLDVLTESVNNPLRMLLGWYAVASVPGAAAELADVLLDDRLLLYGAEAVQRAAGDWRSRRWRARTGRASSGIRRSRCW